MRTSSVRTALVSLLLIGANMLSAQQSRIPPSVPRLLRFSAIFHPTDGTAASPIEGVTFSIYAEEQGGTPLWTETQNVTLDAEGRYTALLGATLPDGVPGDLFAATESRWLGVRFNRPGQLEQPRVLLVSVPYALKAADAETLGGRPASAYLLSPVDSLHKTGVRDPAAPEEEVPAVGPKTVRPAVTSGTANCIGLFTTATDLGCSGMWQSGSYIGIGTASPGAALNVMGQAAIGSGGSGQTYGFDLYVNGSNPKMFIDALGNPGAASLFLQGRSAAGPLNHQLTVNSSGLFSILPSSLGGLPALSIQQNGYVGLGISAPGSALAVNGQAAMGSGGSRQTYGYDLYVNAYNPRALIDAYGVPGVASLFLQGRNATGAGIQQQLSVDAGGTFAITPAASVAPVFSVSQTGSVNVGVNAASRLNVTGDLNLAGALRFQNTIALQASASTGNTGLGALALGLNTTGMNNTAGGYNALAFNSTGNQNSALGGYALYANTTGSYNTAHGYGALGANGSGTYSTATGYNALANTTGAGFNTATGALALSSDTIGQNNTATGYSSLTKTAVGSQNTADGYQALYSNTDGNNNTAAGFKALYTATGSNNVALGYQAGYVVITGSNNVHIGNQGVFTDNGVIRIGAPGTQTSFFAAGIRGIATGNNDAIPVLIDSNGQLGTALSSRRFKEDIRDMGEASKGLLSLRPVTFRYKQPYADGTKPVQYGLIAEEVETVYPELVARSADGQVETVKYQLLDAMLLNEVQAQARELAGQEDRIRELEQQVQELKAAIASIIGRSSR